MAPCLVLSDRCGLFGAFPNHLLWHFCFAHGQLLRSFADCCQTNRRWTWSIRQKWKEKQLFRSPVVRCISLSLSLWYSTCGQWGPIPAFWRCTCFKYPATHHLPSCSPKLIKLLQLAVSFFVWQTPVNCSPSFAGSFPYGLMSQAKDAWFWLNLPYPWLVLSFQSLWVQTPKEFDNIPNPSRELLPFFVFCF